jgi:hypothetical protein
MKDNNNTTLNPPAGLNILRIVMKTSMILAILGIATFFLVDHYMAPSKNHYYGYKIANLDPDLIIINGKSESFNLARFIKNDIGAEIELREDLRPKVMPDHDANSHLFAAGFILAILVALKELFRFFSKGNKELYKSVNWVGIAKKDN